MFRWILAVLFFLIFSFCPVFGQAFADTISFKKVSDRAAKLAALSYQEYSDDKLPDVLKKMDYDQWRDIRFKDAATLWKDTDSPFKVRFFHLGSFYQQPVTVNYTERSAIRPFIFSADLFDYGKNTFQKDVLVDLGFSGFRVHYPINNPEVIDEVAVFLGASYFRAVAKNLFYGMSARGLAVNTALQEGEEFPVFKEFWIVAPRKNDKKIVIYALLDGPSVVGAYQYVIHPGEETVMEVKSTLFIRKNIAKLGIAPLTSMLFFSENSRFAGHEDFRPEVHDSDGVSILSKNGEWIWRPVINPKELLINSFEVETPAGFGLFQRDQNFDHYQDLESRFEARPSVWVTPKDDWGPGHVELLQIPTTNEYNDNINVYWVPERSPQAGDKLNFSYAMSWCQAKIKNPPMGYVTDTRIVRGDHDKNRMRFFVDFQGNNLADLPAEKVLTADISVNKGYKIIENQVFKNVVTGGWRLVFLLEVDKSLLKDMIPGKKPPAELTAALKDNLVPITETWTYTLIP